MTNPVPQLGAPLPTSPLLNFMNNLVAQLMKYGVDSAEAWAKGAQPWLAWPIISSLFDSFLMYLGNIVSVAIQQNVDDIILDIKKNGNNAAVIQAAQKLQADGGTDATDLQNLENQEDTAVSFPGIGNINRI